MNNFSSLLAEIARNAEQATVIHPEDYQNKNGLLVCGRCHTPKQTVIEVPGVWPRSKVFCMCQCEEEKYRRNSREKTARERRDRLQAETISDMDTAAAKAMTLDRDDGSNAFMAELARKYIGMWDTISGSGKGGLVLWGSPGTGKTFYDTAIGNELAKRGVTVARVTAGGVVEAVQGQYDRAETLALLNAFDLLILDDIGAERDTPYAREVIFSLVDNRMKSGKPIIATTNLSLEQMEKPKDRNGNTDTGYKRIFDRLLDMSTPIMMTGASHRDGRQARETIKGMMGGAS